MVKNSKHAAILSIIEIGLGSFFHALKLPFTGQLLSLNQIFILTRASIDTQSKTSPALISTTAALFKSMSPAGKKLTPMLAICAQGQLFSVGTLIFGNNLLGHLLGSLLSALWAYIQPFGIYLLLFGKDLIYMIEYFILKIEKVLSVNHENIYYILMAIIILKIFIAFCLVVVAHYISEEQYSIYQQWAIQKHTKFAKKKKVNLRLSPFYGALKDITSPLFLISILMFIVFFYFSRSDYSALIWQLLRPIAGGYLLFFLIRIYPVEKHIQKMKAGKYKELLAETIKAIKRY